jgi:hypothetical protein
MYAWRVIGEMVLTGVPEVQAQMAMRTLRDDLAERGWGSVKYRAGRIVFNFYPPDVYTAADAHRTAFGMIDSKLDELGIDARHRRWTRVEPTVEEHRAVVEPSHTPTK